MLSAILVVPCCRQVKAACQYILIKIRFNLMLKMISNPRLGGSLKIILTSRSAVSTCSKNGK